MSCDPPSYPFADTAHPDPVSGLSEGIFENPRVTHRPRMFYTNTSAEYWGAGRVAALVHTDPSGISDIALLDEVRLYVPQVDADGNELAGIRLPEVAAPLATATGWMFRPPALGSPDELLPVLRGSWIPFSLPQGQRENLKDPRPSREERYRDREDFLEKTRAAAAALVNEGYLLPEDVGEAVEKSSERWDWSGKQ